MSQVCSGYLPSPSKCVLPESLLAAVLYTVELHRTLDSLDVKGRYCAFFDKIMKPRTFVTLQVLKESGDRGITEKS